MPLSYKSFLNLTVALSNTIRQVCEAIKDELFIKQRKACAMIAFLDSRQRRRRNPYSEEELALVDIIRDSKR